MKKLMIIAVIISGMLMPAQVFAKNDRNERRGANRVQVDHNRVKRGGDKKVINVGKGNPGLGNKHVAVKHHKAAPVVGHHHPKPAPVVVHHHHPKPAPVVVHHHHPHHHPVVVHNHCDNGVAQAAAVAIGIAGLISILAD